MSAGFEDYVDARWPRLVRSAVLMGSDVHAAEDLVQTALAKCYLSWDKVTRAADPDAYVHRVLVNAMVDSRRRRWWGEQPTSRVVDTVAVRTGASIEDQDVLRVALGALPLPQRQVLVLRYYADLTETQTASALGIAIGTVKSRAARALAVLEADPTLRELTTGGEL
jgi:RNA polymerase sigma-70 factor (sigma-E family)